MTSTHHSAAYPPAAVAPLADPRGANDDARERDRRQRRRPVAVVILVVALFFLGLTALGGGVEMVLFPHGNPFVKAEWLDHVPLVDTWVVPGLILGIVFGLGSFLIAFGLLRRRQREWLDEIADRTGHHWPWLATILLGVGLVAWIGVEVVFIPERSVIEVIYVALGVFLVVLPLTRPVRRYLADQEDEYVTSHRGPDE